MVKSIWVGDINEIHCVIDKEKQLIRISGGLGVVEQVFKGDDIFFNIDNTVDIKSKSSLGYFISRLKSFVEGVSEGYFIELEVIGRGYRFINLADKLLVKLGYMHYLGIKPSTGVKIIGTRSKIIIFGLDLEEVNRLAGRIRNFKLPDAYKGKGIRYVDEKLVLKVGKKS